MRITYRRVEHVAGEEDTGDVDEVVSSTANTSGKRTKADGGGLSNDDPRGGSGTKGEENGDEKTEGSLRVGDGCLDRFIAVVRDRGSDTESDEEDDSDCLTTNIDLTAGEVCHEDPGEHDHDSLKCRGDEAQGESHSIGHTGLCMID